MMREFQPAGTIELHIRNPCRLIVCPQVCSATHATCLPLTHICDTELWWDCRLLANTRAEHIIACALRKWRCDEQYYMSMHVLSWGEQGKRLFFLFYDGVPWMPLGLGGGPVDQILRLKINDCNSPYLHVYICLSLYHIKHVSIYVDACLSNISEREREGGGTCWCLFFVSRGVVSPLSPTSGRLICLKADVSLKLFHLVCSSCTGRQYHTFWFLLCNIFLLFSVSYFLQINKNHDHMTLRTWSLACLDLTSK